MIDSFWEIYQKRCWWLDLLTNWTHALNLSIQEGKPVVENVCCAIDCGIVVNPDAAKNMSEGAITDGIGKENKPTGMGGPPFPPIFGAVANALYKASGQRHYQQPFLGNQEVIG